MSGETVFVQLRWEDPDTGTLHEPLLKPPIAIGRETPQMPTQWGNETVSCLELVHRQVSRYHALITVINRKLYVIDKSANGTFLNGRTVQGDGQPFTSKDTLRIGPYKITAALVREGATNATELNVDRSHLAGSGDSSHNAMLIWLAGVAVLVLMGLGTWGVARILLEQSRPQIESDSFLGPNLRPQLFIADELEPDAPDTLHREA